MKKKLVTLLMSGLLCLSLLAIPVRSSDYDGISPYNDIYAIDWD